MYPPGPQSINMWSPSAIASLPARRSREQSPCRKTCHKARPRVPCRTCAAPARLACFVYSLVNDTGSGRLRAMAHGRALSLAGPRHTHRTAGIICHALAGLRRVPCRRGYDPCRKSSHTKIDHTDVSLPRTASAKSRSTSQSVTSSATPQPLIRSVRHITRGSFFLVRIARAMQYWPHFDFHIFISAFCRLNSFDGRYCAIHRRSEFLARHRRIIRQVFPHHGPSRL